jgi:hypothetical protein
MTTPAWVVPGAPAVVLLTRSGRPPYVAETTVKSVDEQFATITNGDRYPLNGLRRASGTYGRFIRLLPATAPEAIAAVRTVRIDKLAAEAGESLFPWREGRSYNWTPEELYAALHAALRPLTEAHDMAQEDAEAER